MSDRYWRRENVCWFPLRLFSELYLSLQAIVFWGVSCIGYRSPSGKWGTSGCRGSSLGMLPFNIHAKAWSWVGNCDTLWRYRKSETKIPASSCLQGFPFCWVPGGTRTHDIQNHKQSCECLINPVFIGVSAIFDFLFAAILRLFTQGPILFQ